MCIEMMPKTLASNRKDSLTGPKVDLKNYWVGHKAVLSSLPILIMAGHADSQGIAGAGTAGEAVDLEGKVPMSPLMSDELFWNLKVRDEVVRIGNLRGLNIEVLKKNNKKILKKNTIF